MDDLAASCLGRTATMTFTEARAFHKDLETQSSTATGSQIKSRHANGVFVAEVVYPSSIRIQLIPENISKHYVYPVAIVNADQNERCRNYAMWTSSLGRTGGAEFKFDVQFTDGQPLVGYHVGCLAGEEWQWVTIRMPMRVVPGPESPTSIHFQVDVGDPLLCEAVEMEIVANDGFQSLDIVRMEDLQKAELLFSKFGLQTHRCFYCRVRGIKSLKMYLDMRAEKDATLDQPVGHILPDEESSCEGGEGGQDQVDVGASAELDSDVEQPSIAVEAPTKEREPHKSSAGRAMQGDIPDASILLPQTDTLSFSMARRKVECVTVWSLPLAINTLTSVSFRVQEISDTFIRLQWFRPKWIGPTFDGLDEDMCQIEESVCQVWEDPIPTLLRNARRVTGHHTPNHYPLQRRQFVAKNIQHREKHNVVAAKLKPSAVHYVVLWHRTRTKFWSHPIRIRVQTSKEVTILRAPLISPDALRLEWEYGMPAPLTHFDVDVDYPAATDLFHGSHPDKPYIGKRRKRLADGQAWGKKEPWYTESGYELRIRDFDRAEEATGSMVIRYSKQTEFEIPSLRPNSSYLVEFRPRASEVGLPPAPWSRPFLVTTAQHVDVRVWSRSSTSLKVAWGRAPPPPIVPLDYDCEHKPFLPPRNEENPDVFYYLEALPVRQQSEGETDPLSDSDKEEHVFYDPEKNYSAKPWFGSQKMIRNSVSRPKPLHVSSAVVEYDEVHVMLFDASHEENAAIHGGNEWMCHLDVYRCGPDPIREVRSKSDWDLAEFEGLSPDTEYVLVLLAKKSGERNFKRRSYQRVRTLRSVTEVVPTTSLGPYAANCHQMWVRKHEEDRNVVYNNLELSVDEMTEVFVVVKWDKSVQATPVTIGSALSEGPLEKYDPPDENGFAVDDVPIEYLVEVQHMVLEELGAAPKGPKRFLYLSSRGSSITITGLVSSCRYDVRIARMNYSTQEWSYWSDMMTVTTLPTLSMEFGDVCSEYLNVRWSKSRLSIAKFFCTVQDVFTKERIDETVKGTAQGYRIPYIRQLRLNSLYDLWFAPLYSNGNQGLQSAKIRFTHCVVDARVIEAGATHILFEWQDFDASKLFTPCLVKNKVKPFTPTVILRLRDPATDWEKTVGLDSNQTEYTFFNLKSNSTYACNVSVFCPLQRCECCSPPPPPEKVRVQDKIFPTVGSTLGVPAGEVKQIGENSVEVVWDVEVERNHTGPLEIEIQMVFERSGSVAALHSVIEENFSPGQRTKGRAIVEGLLPDNGYSMSIRQRYSQQTWGSWHSVLRVATLRRIELKEVHCGESFVELSWKRLEWKPSVAEQLAGISLLQPPRWCVSVEHLGTGEVTEYEATESRMVVEQLESIVPYSITVRQYSVSDWGTPSPALRTYTLPQMVATVEVRGDNYIGMCWARDRRLPQYQFDHCTLHDKEWLRTNSILTRVELEATPLGSSEPPVKGSITCTEDNEASRRGLINGLRCATTYQVSMWTLYSNGSRSFKCSSIVSATAVLPTTTLAQVNEESLSLVWMCPVIGVKEMVKRNGQSLPREARLAEEGSVAKVRTWLVKAVAEEGTPGPHFQHLGNKVVVQTEPGLQGCHVSGLCPNVPYKLLLQSRDEDGNEGLFNDLLVVRTPPLLELNLEQMSESFVQVAWDTQLTQNHLSAGAPTIKQQTIELMVFRAGTNFNKPQDALPIQRKDFAEGSILIEGLTHSTAYGIIGRVNIIFAVDMEIDPRLAAVIPTWGPWCEVVPFSTLPLLLLSAIGVGEDFAVIQWKDVSSGDASVQSDNDFENFEESVRALPDLIEGGSSYFTKPATTAPVLAATAAAVRFQVRTNECTSYGDYAGSENFIFVNTNDNNSFVIPDLKTHTMYAIALRVCYEGATGSWVEEVRVVTDQSPQVRIKEVKQHAVLFDLCFRRGRVSTDCIEYVAVPEEPEQRLFQVKVKDDQAKLVTWYPSSTSVSIRLAKLKRDNHYCAYYREICPTTNEPYGGWCEMQYFWTQPYPPVFGDLEECRDGTIAFTWGIKHRSEPEKLLVGDDVPRGFVYGVEVGKRDAANGDVKEWEEVGVTDVPHIRFYKPELRKTNISQYCFRMRLSKHFEYDQSRKTSLPVWGEYTPKVWWKDPKPPTTLDHVRVPYLSNDCALLRWNFPSNYLSQPGLKFEVVIDPTRSIVNSSTAVLNPMWHYLGKTDQLFMWVRNLDANSIYRIGVRAESNFGFSPKWNFVTITTRIEPNEEQPPRQFMQLDSVVTERSKIRGLRAQTGDRVEITNLYDKHRRRAERKAMMLDLFHGIDEPPPQLKRGNGNSPSVGLALKYARRRKSTKVPAAFDSDEEEEEDEMADSRRLLEAGKGERARTPQYQTFLPKLDEDISWEPAVAPRPRASSHLGMSQTTTLPTVQNRSRRSTLNPQASRRQSQKP